MAKPILKKRFQGVEIAVWQNEYEGKPTYSFSFQKSYKDKDDKWQNTSFFKYSDLAYIAQLCSQTIATHIENSAKAVPKEDKDPSKQVEVEQIKL